MYPLPSAGVVSLSLGSRFVIRYRIIFFAIFRILMKRAVTQTGARKSGRGWANTMRERTKARMNLLRDHTGLHSPGGSTASLGQSFTWLGNPLPVTSVPMQRHNQLDHILLMLIGTLPLRISEERMSCMSSAHVSPAL